VNKIVAVVFDVLFTTTVPNGSGYPLTAEFGSFRLNVMGVADATPAIASTSTIAQISFTTSILPLTEKPVIRTVT
jgi:hypothetical protein